MTAPARTSPGSRRDLLAGATAAALLPLTGAFADAAHRFALANDEGQPLANYKLPALLTPEVLPEPIWVGAAKPDITLVEFFDYNCPYCRASAKDMDAMVRADPRLRLGLVNNAVLSLGSVQAAKVQIAVLKIAGPAVAYRYHMSLLSRHGQTDGAAALDLAQDMRLDRKRVEDMANAPRTGQTSREQMELASSIGFSVTPSFMVAGMGILGYPGPKSTRGVVAALRQCGAIACA